MTGQEQSVYVLGVPFTLEGLFGEVNADAIDADGYCMDIEDDAEGVTATADERNDS